MNVRCPNCKHEGKAKKKVAGSTGMELVLWVFIFPIGFLYSIWRLLNKKYICSECGWEHVVKIK